jgi:ATP synthase protein I
MSEGIARRGQRVLVIQLVIALLAGALSFVLAGAQALNGVIGGSIIAIVLMLMLRFTMQKASELAVESPQTSMNIMYVGAVLRFIMLLVMFAIALGGFKLLPAYTVGGFIGIMIVGVIFSRTSDSGRPISKTDLN